MEPTSACTPQLAALCGQLTAQEVRAIPAGSCPTPAPDGGPLLPELVGSSAACAHLEPTFQAKHQTHGAGRWCRTTCLADPANWPLPELLSAFLIAGLWEDPAPAPAPPSGSRGAGGGGLPGRARGWLSPSRVPYPSSCSESRTHPQSPGASSRCSSRATRASLAGVGRRQRRTLEGAAAGKERKGRADGA